MKKSKTFELATRLGLNVWNEVRILRYLDALKIQEFTKKCHSNSDLVHSAFSVTGVQCRDWVLIVQHPLMDAREKVGITPQFEKKRKKPVLLAVVEKVVKHCNDSCYY